MKILHGELNLDQFFTQIVASISPVLLLDYDGTLAPFTTERDKAVPYPGVRELLSEIITVSKTRLVIISGRAIADLIPLLQLDPIPELWGSHGLQRQLPDGTIIMPTLSDKCTEGLKLVNNWIIKQGLQPYVETKPAGFAFHWRGEEDSKTKALKETVYDKWRNIIGRYGLSLHEFDGGIEIRLDNISKANAVIEIIKQTPPEEPIAFLGDDITDEDGFQALKNRGLSVLVRREIRQTFADLWLIPPDELLMFLKRWLKSAR